MTKTKDDQKWLDSFALELRLNNVGGAEVGDAVAHVESYCADSGETPRDAFGDPAEYARSLELTTEKWDFARITRAALPSLVGLVAFFVFLQALDGVYRGEPFSINIWQAGFIALLLAAAVTAMVHLRALVTNKWAMIAFAAAGPATGVGIALSGTMASGSPAVALPALPVALAAAATLLAAALWGHFRDRKKADPTINPIANASVAPQRGAQAISGLGNWLLVLAAPVFAVTQYLIASR